MIFSPSHLPDRFYIRGLTTLTTASVDNARALIQSNQGNSSFYLLTTIKEEHVKCLLLYQSICLTLIQMVSLIPRSASLISKSIPVFCVMSSAEQSLGKDYFFSKLPNHPLSKYIDTSASHMDAAEATLNEALLFIQSVSNY